MRKFIVSDLHGCGEVYDSIIGYLENISLMDEVVLYINGDLIDRGMDGFRMLMDVYERINGKGNIKIEYLAGNHELMMYQALIKRKKNHAISHWSDWILNGGWIIEGELDSRDDGEEMCEQFKTFLGKLEVYKVFSEKINGNRLVLVHAAVPNRVYEKCHLKIEDNNKEVEHALWTREEIRESFLFFVGKVIGYNRIGKDGYLTIKGHTVVNEYPGFIYNEKDNYINIDGGCAAFAVGEFEKNYVPLVEVLDDSLRIIIFNHNNEIIDGYYLNKEIEKISDSELKCHRLLINHELDEGVKKVKKNILEFIDYT